MCKRSSVILWRKQTSELIAFLRITPSYFSMRISEFSMRLIDSQPPTTPDNYSPSPRVSLCSVDRAIERNDMK